MTADHPQTIPLESGQRVSAILQTPDDTPRACYVFAHGAGAGMNHPFMAATATGLAERGIATLRYQFPYMERGAKRPDPPAIAQATVRAAVAEAARRLPGVPLIAGGKSFGGRMTSQAQAEAPLPGVSGLVFFGFPLHPPGKPGDGRGQHLLDVEIPLLFLQGSRDEFAQTQLLQPLVQRLGGRATLHLIEGANHSFRVSGRGAVGDVEVRSELLGTMLRWLERIL